LLQFRFKHYSCVKIIEEKNYKVNEEKISFVGLSPAWQLRGHSNNTWQSKGLGGGVRSNVSKWHRGEGGGKSTKMSRVIKFHRKSLRKAIFSVKWKLSCHNGGEGGGAGGPTQCHQMTYGGGGSKNRPKKCHVLFEWLLTAK